MEKIFSVLRQLSSRLGVLASIPPPIKVSLMVFGVVVGVFAVFKVMALNRDEKIFLIIAIVLLGLITAGYYAWKWWADKKHNKLFGNEIAQHSSATPRPLSDPGQRARLDDLRKKFQSGVEAYKARGKDLYKLPWYLMVGEPGSGKTEAIRHSSVGFPPGMQDEFQGVGGTINMNWWFTNRAVILDTAGRLIFEDVKPGETSEWKEFLALLRKNRPNCPVNGLFLVIPSDSLIKDSSEEIQKKAGKIAQQLGLIQRVLDIRFPVVILITKCDKINGFREFFDGLTDPELQQQMLGWANREPLDEPFKPDTVGKHLEQVVARLRRRRFGLLRDPVPENSEGRRTEEVDSLYAFPQSLEHLSSRLRQYLESIFTTGEWAPRPLFLRGIFFSSSMREGAALDAELAQAMGMSVEELPEGKVWERERAFFLRDLFLEKVFKEKGLVTRASNTKAMLRGRQLALLGSGFVLLLLFLAIAWKAKSKLLERTEESRFWQAIQARGWSNKIWNASMITIAPGGGSQGVLRTNRVEVPELGTNYSFGDFQLLLKEHTDRPLPSRPVFFPGLPASYEANRKIAQRVFFDNSVVHPLLKAAREKMSVSSIDPASAHYQPDALATLIKLESDIITRGTNANESPQEKCTRFLVPLENYVAGREALLDANLVAAMAGTYWSNSEAKSYWPPSWCSGAYPDTNDFTHNFPIQAGIRQLVKNATNDLSSHIAQGAQISALLTAARKFYLTESGLFSNSAPEVERSKFLKAHSDVLSAAAELTRAANQEVLGGSISLSNAYRIFEASVYSNTVATLNRVEAANRQARAATKDYKLFLDIENSLRREEINLSNQVAHIINSANAVDLEKLENHFDTNGFGKRVVIYALANKLFARQPPFTSEMLVGFQGLELDDFLKKLNPQVYEGKLTNQFKTVLLDYRKRAEREYFESYVDYANKQLISFNGFPLTSDTNRVLSPENCKEAAKQLNLMSKDLGSPLFDRYEPSENPQKWKSFIASIHNREKVAKVLLGNNGELGSCDVSLEPRGSGNDDWRSHWRDLRLSSGTAVKIVRTGTDSTREAFKVPIQQKMALVLMDNASGTKESISVNIGEWAPLRLLLQYRATRAGTNTWLVNVEFPIPRQSQSIVVPLKLKFSDELPAADQWPSP